MECARVVVLRKVVDERMTLRAAVVVVDLDAADVVADTVAVDDVGFGIGFDVGGGRALLPNAGDGIAARISHSHSHRDEAVVAAGEEPAALLPEPPPRGDSVSLLQTADGTTGAFPGEELRTDS